ncbi:CheR family methyltransferase [Sphingomonas glaciei]|uniref:Protein-glutamate O-methyltransferase CheR n=1 Tax=Sphingomonas glaciei TaxID=2938948 RepID=A0ABY5MWN3_9SPHN|nr:CheR family methyltransferase [Sphingomonas glaciei]UUR07879.1 protein-glutamate O-methyltransferase CheR [Sphingomonas glaciei]
MSHTPAEPVEDIEIKLLLEALYLRYHFDFRHYAKASIKRRLRQARDQLGFATFSAMQEKLLHSEAMVGTLLDYLTVQVSEMFRDPGYFKAMRERVLPHLRTYPSLKIWIAGCSHGEEVYSFAIMLLEEGLLDRTMIYATDINPGALEIARSGVYPLDRIAAFTRNHQQAGGKTSLADHYTTAYGRAVFDKKLRAQVVFSDHSLVTDEVFTECQLVSCRNVMIYFDRPLQDRAVGLFRDSLTRRGFLGLGSKETLRFSEHAGAFTDFVREEKIYQRSEA